MLHLNIGTCHPVPTLEWYILSQAEFVRDICYNDHSKKALDSQCLEDPSTPVEDMSEPKFQRAC